MDGSNAVRALSTAASSMPTVAYGGVRAVEVDVSHADPVPVVSSAFKRVPVLRARGVTVGKQEPLSNRGIGLALVAIGLAIILAAVAVAFNAFYTYTVPGVRGSSIEEVISTLAGTLVEVAVRLGFLGLAVWGAGILLRHGVGLLK